MKKASKLSLCITEENEYIDEKVKGGKYKKDFVLPQEKVYKELILMVSFRIYTSITRYI